MSFVEKLSDEALAFFNEIAGKSFQEQAVAFLNAYWAEVSTQAEFIYSVSWEMMKYADMHAKGVSLIHLYDEGQNVDFDIGLYFYEQLNKKLDAYKDGGDKKDGENWADEKYAMSLPKMMTALARKKELREKVDVNFDGRVSMLEYLLYQYRDFANPANFVERSMAAPDEHEEIRRARLALEEVNRRIKEYEAERHRLEEASKKPGIKGLQATHSLKIFDEGPLKEALNEALLHAEAAVRAAQRKFGKGGSGGGAGAGGSAAAAPTEGTMWWMARDLEEKKRRYGR